MTTPLLARLRARIEADGPMSVAEYMAVCLGDPEHGYYATRDPLGAGGDFVTAPEISQMFGELLGAAMLDAFRAAGAPPAVVVAELGPGRGTLMADLLRVATRDPAFAAAASLHLVETSPTLRRAQAARLAAHRPVFHDAVATLPDGPPLLVVANEFFDALPIRQFVRTAGGWRERMVGLGVDGALAFGAGPGAVAPDLLPAAAAHAPPGTIVEVNRASEAVAGEIAARIAARGGAFIAFDYGSPVSGTGDTLQAVRGHAFAGVLDAPGEADLTAHVDFAALAAAARAAAPAIRVFGPRAQGHVLLDLGLLERAGALGRDRDAATRAALAAAVERLAGEDGMGRLFQAIGFSSGFELAGFAPAGGRL